MILCDLSIVEASVSGRVAESVTLLLRWTFETSLTRSPFNDAVFENPMLIQHCWTSIKGSRWDAMRMSGHRGRPKVKRECRKDVTRFLIVAESSRTSRARLWDPNDFPTVLTPPPPGAPAACTGAHPPIQPNKVSHPLAKTVHGGWVD